MKTLELLHKNRKKIYELATKYGISEVFVFGSVARGKETKNSDIDLLVEVKNYKKYSIGFGHVPFESEVEKILNRKVDVITKKSLHPLLKAEITTTAKAL